MNQPNKIEALSDEATILSKVFVEYRCSLETAQRLTNGKAVECTKVVYEYGIKAFADIDVFMAILDANDIKLRGGYSASNHFLGVVKLLANLAGIPLNTGELARIAATCRHAHDLGVPVEGITAYIEQMGGVRKAYDVSVAARHGQGTPLPEADVDESLRLEIHSDAGFQGILDVPPAFVAKLIRKWGVVGPVTDGGGHPPATNDNSGELGENGPDPFDGGCGAVAGADAFMGVNDNGGANSPVYIQDWAITNLNTLNSYGRFDQRQKLLLGQIEADTKNGDVCLTADQLWQAPLKALNLSEYDMDVASPGEGTICYKGHWTYSPIAAKHRLTVEQDTFGGLDRTWGEVVWCNPPYGNYSWATFCEKAKLEVAAGNAKLVVCLVPATSGNISCHVNDELWDDHAYEITFNQRIHFWMTRSEQEETIAGSRFIIYGRPDVMRMFIPRLADQLYAVGVIGDSLRRFHHSRAAKLFVCERSA